MRTRVRSDHHDHHTPKALIELTRVEAFIHLLPLAHVVAFLSVEPLHCIVSVADVY